MDYNRAIRVARAIFGGDFDKVDASNGAGVPFLFGFGIGVVMGILFAAQSGGETRDYIAEKAKEGLDQAAARGRDWGKRAQEFVTQGKEQINQAVESGKQAYQEEKGRAY